MAEVINSWPALTFSGLPAEVSIFIAPKIISKKAIPPAILIADPKSQPTNWAVSLVGIQPKAVMMPVLGPAAVSHSVGWIPPVEAEVGVEAGDNTQVPGSQEIITPLEGSI